MNNVDSNSQRRVFHTCQLLKDIQIQTAMSNSTVTYHCQLEAIKTHHCLLSTSFFFLIIDVKIAFCKYLAVLHHSENEFDWHDNIPPRDMTFA